MNIHYKNKPLERILIGVDALAATAVMASFVLLLGFNEPPLPQTLLHAVQVILLTVFIAEKTIRLFNAISVKKYLRANCFEISFLVVLGIAVIGIGWWRGENNQQDVRNMRHFAICIYLVLEVITKLCRTCVKLAASGKNPTRTLILSFMVLIMAGAGVLTLPRAAVRERVSFVDALFTATSATCVTGLIVKDTGTDFSLMGQIIILVLVQLGGLGIVVFGAVFALLLGQALSVRESVAMQDLLNARTLGRIGNMIVFIFVGTVIIEAVGAISMFAMFDNVPGKVANTQQQWFYSIFHSISAFCNSGFSLFNDSLIGYSKSWQVYIVICPLIILGGLGFGVLYDLSNIAADRVKRFLKGWFNKDWRFFREAPKRMLLQTKIVLCMSALLIGLGTAAFLLFERYASSQQSSCNIFSALFQSITARTAGFNTVDISSMSASSKLILLMLMFVGGSPGSTAGGIKTVTLAVIILTTIAALRKRPQVEMFRRSIRIVVVGRAITITMLFVVVLFTATLALSITENGNGFSMSDIIFEAGSALGTVGLSCGMTGALTTAGKIIIIIVMLIGRLGPLTLLAALTFNLRPIRYDYPEEAIIVG